MNSDTGGLVFPSQPGEVADYLIALLKDHGDEPEAIKAGIRFTILALKRMEKSRMVTH
jgi:hypothetical protein